MKNLVFENFGLHSLKVPSQIAGMKVIYSSNLTYVDSGLPCDTFNIIHITNGEKLTEQELTDAISYYQSKKFPFCIWIANEYLTENTKSHFNYLGLQVQNKEPGMMLDLTKADVRPSSSNTRLIKTSNELEMFARVIARNWTPADQNVIRYYEQVKDVVLNSKDVFLIGHYENQQMVAVGELFPTDHNTIGIYGVATLSEFRGRGLGTSVMSFAINQAKELGYKNMILQASEKGIGIYKKLGFEVVTTYYEYA